MARVDSIARLEFLEIDIPRRIFDLFATRILHGEGEKTLQTVENSPCASR